MSDMALFIFFKTKITQNLKNKALNLVATFGHDLDFYCSCASCDYNTFISNKILA